MVQSARKLQPTTLRRSSDSGLTVVEAGDRNGASQAFMRMKYLTPQRAHFRGMSIDYYTDEIPF